MITENVSTLEIHKLTQAQYDRAFEAGTIKENAIYLTPNDCNAMSAENPTGTGSFSLNRKADTTIGMHSTAMGFDSEASGYCSMAMGNNATASGDNSFAIGWYTTSSGGGGSVAMGDHTTASNASSFAIGETTTASGYVSYAEGCQTSATDDTAAEPQVTYETGDGYYTHAEGYGTVATGTCAHAEGNGTKSSGRSGHAEGRETVASGNVSHAQGYQTKALGNYSHSQGYKTTADGACSYSSGCNTVASGYQTVFGKFNTEKSGATGMNDQSANSTIFIVGNGKTISNDAGDEMVETSNALRITADGQTYGLKSFSATGADFAEYFEWIDGNPTNEDRRGRIVTLDGDKIRYANAEDTYLLGVVSTTGAFIGNSSSENWQGKYLKDVFGEWITEQVEVTESVDEETGEIIPAHTETHYAINPDYNPEEEYISREFRKEWSPVGFHGQLVVVDDGTCEVNSYCKPSQDGIGTAAEDGYRVMKRLDDTHIKVLVK